MLPTQADTTVLRKPFQNLERLTSYKKIKHRCALWDRHPDESEPRSLFPVNQQCPYLRGNFFSLLI